MTPLTAVPAQAKTVYAGCDSPTYSETVKFKKKFAYSIEQQAIGCAEHHDLGGCTMLVSFDTFIYRAGIEVADNVRNSRIWDDGNFVIEPMIPGCSQATTAKGPPSASAEYKGAFPLTWKGKKYIARPSLKVTFNGFNTEGSIVAFNRTGQWDFKRLKKNSPLKNAGGAGV